MKTLRAKHVRYGFDRLINLGRAEPVEVAKHPRPFVVVMAVQECERLKVVDIGDLDSRPNTGATTKY